MNRFKHEIFLKCIFRQLSLLILFNSSPRSKEKTRCQVLQLLPKFQQSQSLFFFHLFSFHLYCVSILLMNYIENYHQNTHNVPGAILDAFTCIISLNSHILICMCVQSPAHDVGRWGRTQNLSDILQELRENDCSKFTHVGSIKAMVLLRFCSPPE